MLSFADSQFRLGWPGYETSAYAEKQKITYYNHRVQRNEKVAAIKKKNECHMAAAVAVAKH